MLSSLMRQLMATVLIKAKMTQLGTELFIPSRTKKNPFILWEIQGFHAEIWQLVRGVSDGTL
jgi:hypothetical protein